MEINKERIDCLKREYPAGTRIKLVSMKDDPKPIEAGSEGSVAFMDDMGTIHMNWDNGRTIGLIDGVDTWEIMPKASLTPRM